MVAPWDRWRTIALGVRGRSTLHLVAGTAHPEDVLQHNVRHFDHASPMLTRLQACLTGAITVLRADRDSTACHWPPQERSDRPATDDSAARIAAEETGPYRDVCTRASNAVERIGAGGRYRCL